MDLRRGGILFCLLGGHFGAAGGGVAFAAAATGSDVLTGEGGCSEGGLAALGELFIAAGTKASQAREGGGTTVECLPGK